MQVYLVGGAVRDRLLGREIRERDFVVVGGTSEAMLAQGFQKVGRDFPIFLHPHTHEEYALARSVRPSDHQPGEVIYDASVTLEEDLARRDLTINAIAEDNQGQLIDPFGGCEDLHNRQLRHISDAFCEDSIRILRIARFMARYADLEFTIAPETRQLLIQIVQGGQLDRLVPERVWQELLGALGERKPKYFFVTLRELGAQQRVFPEIDALWGVPQPIRWHPEVDCAVHTLMALAVACSLSESLEVRFAALTHDLGKGTTPERILPSHYGHEGRGARLVEQLCYRLKAPARFRELACRCATYHGYLHRLYELQPKTILKLLMGLDTFRQPERLSNFVLVCQADFQGRNGFQQRPYPHAQALIQLYQVASEVRSETVDATLIGKLLGDAICRERVARIDNEMTLIKQTHPSVSSIS
ncbi:MAG: multifunctional CCA addition/repair protein [Candidatus Thiodiazotropha sp. (ex Lucinoma aequizonata)]|nr:multifunctional CCA addition/repair protein [Candidatus Thiodiazotropha sp. (ex Lucinoma aequizonata)]MCU7889798.1 multifunctional CCA addition/repair protein [Candidatus Thiodiazotropha sp. (ex Lucinoma aequizonata)]MCU7895704.1 multifunctional CCA addition/repair protein [Candidatus Thiodiazotropha sp. (ex Lucinoma aequizonata)]MCU7897744.1 multifunctional CCA addition/repair protein [Candidatus Thiodiazotropha sp. (ex Lucinoma aequizonata)]MCU7903964.1 multifunctional CCA addition/repair 